MYICQIFLNTKNTFMKFTYYLLIILEIKSALRCKSMLVVELSRNISLINLYCPHTNIHIHSWSMKAKHKADFSLSLEEQLSYLLKYANYIIMDLHCVSISLYLFSLSLSLSLSFSLCVLWSQISCMSQNRIYMNAIEMSLKWTFYRYRT